MKLTIVVHDAEEGGYSGRRCPLTTDGERSPATLSSA